MEKDWFVKSVSRALQIMDILSNERHGMGVTEIAKQIGIHKSSVYRLLSTLVEYG
ncbi:MAG: helix-turn-helix domain-containing protein, partial [Anoxybacillus ayderensis]|nr:helix-turn-helix domain-containing protein [Anoxybacillus ayderensis]